MRNSPLVQAFSLSFFFHTLCACLLALILRASSHRSRQATEASLDSIQVQNVQASRPEPPALRSKEKRTFAEKSEASRAVPANLVTTTSSKDGDGKDAYALQVRSKILSFQHYPEIAKARKQEGTVILNFQLGNEGELIALSFEATDAAQALIEAAQEAVKDSSPFGPLPKDHASAFRIAIQFRLQNL